MEIRKADKGDIEELAQFITVCFVEPDFALEWRINLLKRIVKSYVVAIEDGHIIAAACVSNQITIFTDGMEGKWISDFCVAPALRGKGLARQLIEWIGDDYSVSLNLTCKAGNMEFWKKLGFEFDGDNIFFGDNQEFIGVKDVRKKTETLPITSA